NFFKTLQAPGLGLQFPIFSKPATAFGLLLGKQVTLFTYDMPTLRVGFTFRQTFPIIPPLDALVAGSLGASAHFPFGYDCHGLTEFAVTHDPASFADGFFIDNAHGPQVTLTGTISAGAALDLGVAEADVTGGIRATVNFKLNGPDKF